MIGVVFFLFSGEKNTVLNERKYSPLIFNSGHLFEAHLSLFPDDFLLQDGSPLAVQVLLSGPSGPSSKLY